VNKRRKRAVCLSLRRTNFFGGGRNTREALDCGVSDSGGAGMEIRFERRRFRGSRIYRMAWKKVLSRSGKRSGTFGDKVARLPRTSESGRWWRCGQTTGSECSAFPPIAGTKGNVLVLRCAGRRCNRFENRVRAGGERTDSGVFGLWLPGSGLLLAAGGWLPTGRLKSNGGDLLRNFRELVPTS